MPLTPIQRKVVEVLRPFRTAHYFVAGGAALNHDWPRLSDDTDIFRDTQNKRPLNVDAELDALRKADFSIDTVVNSDETVDIIVRKYGFETRVQWFNDPEICKRFFPAVEDDNFGYRLHQADIAVDKVLCASRRRTAPRDAVDLVHIVRLYCELGPLVWAAIAKDRALSPVRMVQEIRRIAFGYSDEEIRAVRMEGDTSITRVDLRETLGAALDRARDYCENLAPADWLGCLFVDQNDVPIEATDEILTDGRAKALSLQNFGAAPEIY